MLANKKNRLRNNISYYAFCNENDVITVHERKQKKKTSQFL